MALVPDDGDDFYLAASRLVPYKRVDLLIDAFRQMPERTLIVIQWVQQHVIPYLDMVPEQLFCPRLTRKDAAHALERYLRHDPNPLIVADWPEDVAQFCNLLITGPGDMVELRHLTFQLTPMSNFSTAGNSKVPHNALHDARSLRDHVIAMEP